MVHTTVLLLPSLPACLPPRMSGALLQWWCCRELWEQGVHWWSPGQQGRRPRSKVARWKQESCIRSWSRCVELRADVSCIPARKPGRTFNEQRAGLMLNQQRAAFWQLQTQRAAWEDEYLAIIHMVKRGCDTEYTPRQILIFSLISLVIYPILSSHIQFTALCSYLYQQMFLYSPNPFFSCKSNEYITTCSILIFFVLSYLDVFLYSIVLFTVTHIFGKL